MWMGWTEDRIERLKNLWVDGFSASQIASELGGVTRNAVIGKVHRLGLRRRLDSTRQPRICVARAECSDRPRSAKVAALAFTPRLRQPVAVVIPTSRRISLMEIKAGLCRWPLGNPLTPDFAFCGGDCSVGRPYCPAHASVAFVAGKGLKAAINSIARAWPR